MQHVPIEYLKVFCDVVRFASFSRGARENNISQPSASVIVNQLEERLGVKLIDRSKRPLLPTSQGRLYYEGCRDLCHRYLEIENQVKASVDERRVGGSIRIAAIYSIGVSHMSWYVHRFKESHPKVAIRLEYLHPDRVYESVLDEQVDLGLVSFPTKKPELTVIPWRDEVMVLAVHPSHRLAGTEEIDVRALDGERLVHFDANLAIRRSIDKFLKRYQIEVDVALEFDNIESIKRAVEVPGGAAILPEVTLAREVKEGSIVPVRFRNASLVRPLAIIHRKPMAMNAPVARFLQLLRDHDPTQASATAPPPFAGLDALDSARERALARTVNGS